MSSLSYDNKQAFDNYMKLLKELQVSFDESAQRIVTQQAAVGIAETIKNTPTGTYDKNVSFITNDGKFVNFQTSGKKVGGTLKRGWKLDPAQKIGRSVQSGYSNNVKYAMYVNNGHRIVSKGITWGFVKGKRMLEMGITTAKMQTQTIFDNEISRIKAKTGF